MNQKWIIKIACVFLIIGFASICIFRDQGKRIETVKYQHGAIEALEFFGKVRAYPDRIMPGDKFYHGFDSARKTMMKTAELGAKDSWENIGPYNQGGRTIALAVDPNNPETVYAGSASGGLWRMTIQSGTNYSWENIDTGYPVLGVNAIAVDPSDSDVLYIGTGEVYSYQGSDGGLYNRLTRGSYGIGLLKSTDRGLNWTKSIDWTYNQERGVLVIKINPQNNNEVFAGTSEGVYRSRDAGLNWELVHDVVMAVDIRINPVDPNIIFVSNGNFGSTGNGIYRSIDGGDTWTMLEGGLPVDWTGKTLLDLYEASPNVIYADVADNLEGIGLYRSVDNGDNWDLINTQDYASYQGWFAHYVRVDPVDSSKIVIAGVQFGTSDDGGKLFYRNDDMHVDHHAFANHPTDPDIIYFGNDGGVYRTLNGGEITEWLNYGYITTQFYNGFSSSEVDSNLAIGGLQDNSTVLYKGNPNWETGLIGGDGAYTAMHPFNKKIMFGSAQRNAMYKSNDGGQTWANVNTGLTGRGNDAAFIAPYYLVRESDLYAATDKVFWSSSLGATWVLPTNSGLNGNSIIALGLTKHDVSQIFAATVPANGERARVYKSKDYAYTWTDITGDLPDRFIRDLYVSTHNKDVVYVILSGFGSSHLYRSENGGESWENIGANLPDVPTSTVITDPRDHRNIYVGNDLGVYVSTDYGLTWSEFQTGMPTAAMVMDLSISKMNRKLRAVTHGNGVYERTLLDPGDILVYPETVKLIGNYPNPFNPRTRIDFSLLNAGKVKIEVYNVLGQKIKTLANRDFDSGYGFVDWEGKNDQGQSVPSGVYFYTLTADGKRNSGRMTLLK